MSETAIQQKTPARAWGILAVTYLASVAAPMTQMKVPALADWIIPSVILPVTGGDAVAINTYFGLLMTALSIIGVILAFPASAIAKKFGLKATVLLSVACLAIGSAICIPDNLITLYIGRVFEGIGIGLMGVIAPSCIAVWFPTKTRGTALGIWATWFPLGITIILNLAPAMAQSFGYHSIYYFLIGLDIVAFILFAIIFKMPDNMAQAPAGAKREEKFSDGLKYLKSPLLWILALIFFCFNFIQLGCVNTFYPTFLTSNGWDVQAANFATSVNTFLGIPFAAIAGIVYDKIPHGKKHILWIIIFVCWAIGFYFGFQTGDKMFAMVWFYTLFVGVFNGFACGSLRPAAPSLVPATTLGATISMALLQFMQNLGNAVGSPIYGAVSGALGYTMADYVLIIPICIICVILCFLFGLKALYKKQEKIEEGYAAMAQAAEEE